eukprot:6213161-Pleurochrysis_carterae.AAC.1
MRVMIRRVQIRAVVSHRSLQQSLRLQRQLRLQRRSCHPRAIPSSAPLPERVLPLFASSENANV